MQLIEWDQKYSVNVKAIDEEHKKLIKLINDLHDAMRSGQGRLIVGTILEELKNYAQTHFKNEERFMEQAAFPGLPSHRLIHAQFVSQVEELIEKMETGSLSLSMEVMGFLKSWLINHIQGTDKAFSSHLNEKGFF